MKKYIFSRKHRNKTEYFIKILSTLFKKYNQVWSRYKKFLFINNIKKQTYQKKTTLKFELFLETFEYLLTRL